jgi:tetratricopeptide (TPR) repeat protein
MIDILKKRYKVGDTVTLHMAGESFTGVIDAFEDTCVILSTEEGDEFIANEAVKRISIPKSFDTKKIEVRKEKEGKLKEPEVIEIVKLLEVEEIEPIIVKETLLKVEHKVADVIPLKVEEIEPIVVKETLPKVEYKVGDVIPLEVEKIEPIIVKETLPKTEYKVGDVMPLEVLEKRTSKQQKRDEVKRAKKKYKDNKKAGEEKYITFSDPSKLIELILPEIKAENKKIVSANGTLHTYWADRNYGFITDIWRNEVHFHFSEIIDNELLEKLRGTSKNDSIPVCFSLKKSFKGEKAIFIHKPKTVEQVAELAKQYFEKEGKPDTALGLVEQILFSYPQNYTAIKLKEEIEQKRSKQFDSKKSYKNYDSFYQKAVKAKNIHKNFEEALKYYFKAFENDEKIESCIKDIGMLYVSMGETEKAIEFINKYENELPDSITNYNYFENFYSSVKDFEKVLDYTELLLEEKSVLNDKRKYSMYLSKKGFALIQLDELEEAGEVLEEAASIHPENTYASRLLQALDEPDNEELSQIIADAEFDSFGGGFSRYIKDTLENYNEYYGVPAKVIDSGDFSKETLNAIRRLIGTAGRARPRERANYLLTEAKLMTALEPEKENSLRSILARHCNAMALNHISENSSMDVIRYYYLEAFSLEENYGFTAPQVAIYLYTFKSSYTGLFSVSTKTPSIDYALGFVLDGEYRESIWEGILSMFLWNRSISAQIISKLFENNLFKEKSIIFLMSLDLIKDKNISADEYTNIWNQAREKRQRDYSRWFSSIKAITNNESLENLINFLVGSLNEAKRNWLTQLDASRLNFLSKDICEVLSTYLRQSGYRDKEISFKNSKSIISGFISEIKEKPTKFSYEGFIPLLEKMEFVLEKSFKTVEAASIPKVDISILGEANVLSNDSVVPFQVKVESSKNSSPIRNLKIIVQNTNDVSCTEKTNEYFNSINGGESHIFNISVKVSSKIVTEKATSINVTCFYSTRTEDEPVTLEKQLSLRLYSESEFETIPNPYEQLANGGPVTDRGMFYGRNEFIDRITEAIISTDSKQVVIYGQKRSGKSSVLYHLKKSLENTQKTFCISFSIGEIFENISSATFFHKILFTIEEELENLAFDGIEVPAFKCPSYKELKESPNSADIFRKSIRNFKRICLNTPNWADKKLVVMIDEFTYLYTAIKEGKVSDAIMKQWKAITQNEDATFSSVLVGQDVFPLFKSDFPNEFGITQDERLTYLSKRDALKLIEEPVWNSKSNKSRYLEDATEKIIEYTSCNPYYIQIFCARLIKEMNEKKFIEATRSDIKPIADSFLFGGQALTADKFDNLLNAGEKHDIQSIPQEHSKAILKKIAEATKFVPYCSREDINIGDKKYEDLILNDLKNREVIEQQGNNYKIQVKLFQEWLLKN